MAVAILIGAGGAPLRGEEDPDAPPLPPAKGAWQLIPQPYWMQHEVFAVDEARDPSSPVIAVTPAKETKALTIGSDGLSAADAIGHFNAIAAAEHMELAPPQLEDYVWFFLDLVLPLDGSMADLGVPASPAGRRYGAEWFSQVQDPTMAFTRTGAGFEVVVTTAFVMGSTDQWVIIAHELLVGDDGTITLKDVQWRQPPREEESASASPSATRMTAFPPSAAARFRSIAGSPAGSTATSSPP